LRQAVAEDRGSVAWKSEVEVVIASRAFGIFLAAFILATGAGVAQARDLNTLYDRILRDPANAELNLQFARQAEEQGQTRWALAAYERILLNDPDNFDAKVGMMRIRRKLQPGFTLVTAEFGTAFESNPRYYLPDSRSELQGFGILSLRDERNLGGTRWRTTGAVAGWVHQKEGELDYGHIGGETGPVIDLFPGLSVAPAIGGAAAYFDDRFYYAEAAASATFESSLDGAYRALRVRGAYRSYDDFYPSQDGFYAEARARFAQPGVLGDGSVGIFSPYVLWSNIKGKVVNALITEIQPGAYLEYGARVEAYKNITDWLTVGANFGISKRDYRNDIVVATGVTREDVIFSPGATLLFPGLFGFNRDLRFEYKYLRDNSNDPTKSFEDHLVSAAFVARFDPTIGFPTPR
jgi:hypothetical protein